ncbi:MAG: hypothetical protein PF637_04270 [Spirochaetes bacterium]|jgi:hypothetical protein|nr:hypothetical protein [Spirochaetota bacterium]
MSKSETTIRTTISVQSQFLTIIEDYAYDKGIKSSDVMNLLLLKQMNKMANNPKSSYCAMKYQERGLEYKSPHITLSPAMYARLKNIMFLFRVTLSYLLSMAMKSFEELLGEKEKVDCYPPSSHSSIIDSVDGILIYANYWGVPERDHTITIPSG